MLQFGNVFLLCFSVCFLLGPPGIFWGSFVEPLARPAAAPSCCCSIGQTFGSLSSDDRMRAHSDALCPELISCFVAEANLLNHSVQSGGGSPGAQTEDTGEEVALRDIKESCGHTPVGGGESENAVNSLHFPETHH